MGLTHFMIIISRLNTCLQMCVVIEQWEGNIGRPRQDGDKKTWLIIKWKVIWHSDPSCLFYQFSHSFCWTVGVGIQEGVNQEQWGSVFCAFFIQVQLQIVLLKVRISDNFGLLSPKFTLDVTKYFCQNKEFWVAKRILIETRCNF